MSCALAPRVRECGRTFGSTRRNDPTGRDWNMSLRAHGKVALGWQQSTLGSRVQVRLERAEKVRERALGLVRGLDPRGKSGVFAFGVSGDVLKLSGDRVKRESRVNRPEPSGEGQVHESPIWKLELSGDGER